MSDFYNSTTRRARKPFRCELYRMSVAVGNSYFNQSGRYEDELFQFKICLDCKDFMDTIFTVFDLYGKVNFDVADEAAWCILNKPNSKVRKIDRQRAFLYQQRREIATNIIQEHNQK